MIDPRALLAAIAAIDDAAAARRLVALTVYPTPTGGWQASTQTETGGWDFGAGPSPSAALAALAASRTARLVPTVSVLTGDNDSEGVFG